MSVQLTVYGYSAKVLADMSNKGIRNLQKMSYSSFPYNSVCECFVKVTAFTRLLVVSVRQMARDFCTVYYTQSLLCSRLEVLEENLSESRVSVGILGTELSLLQAKIVHRYA